MKRLLSLTVLAFFITTFSTLTAQQKDISLEEIWGPEFHTERLDVLRSLKNGKEYSVLNYNKAQRASTIEVFDYKSGKKVQTLLSSGEFSASTRRATVANRPLYTTHGFASKW